MRYTNHSAIAVAAISIVFILSACAPTDYCTSTAYAEMAAEDSIKAILRNGRTAKFHDVQTTSSGNCSFRITGSVEATNGFGAMIDQGFEMHIKSTGQGAYTPTYARLGGQVIVGNGAATF